MGRALPPLRQWSPASQRLSEDMDAAEKYIDAERFHEVQSKLKIQARDAVWWKDACLLYFQEFSGMPIPYEIERPIHELKDLQKVHLPISNYECPTKELLNKNR